MAYNISYYCYATCNRLILPTPKIMSFRVFWLFIKIQGQETTARLNNLSTVEYNRKTHRETILPTDTE
jgi:hypothetical protein